MLEANVTAEASDMSTDIDGNSMEGKLESLRNDMLRRDEATQKRLTALEGKLSDVLGQMNKVDEMLELVRDNTGVLSLYSDDSQEWGTYNSRQRLSLSGSPLPALQPLSPDVAYLKISGLTWNDREFESSSPKKTKKKLLKLMEHFFSNTLSMPHKEVKQLSVCDVLVHHMIFQDETPKSSPFVVVGFSKPSDIEEVKEYRKAAKLQGYIIEEYSSDDCLFVSSCFTSGNKRRSIIKQLSAG